MNVQETNQVSIQFGKGGISESFVANIKKSLVNNKLVKVKFLKSALEGKSRKDLASSIVSSLQAVPVEHKLVGNVLFLKRIKR